MITLKLKQGSPEWYKHRVTARNASEASATLGFSPHTSRNELLKQKATGIVPEVDWHTQKRFDDGHRVEAMARPNIEKIIGEAIYPVTATSDDGRYSASYDGITVDQIIFWENKIYNAELAAYIEEHKDLPDSHWPQVEQGFIVNELAEKCLFTLCDIDGNVKVQLWYESRQDRREMVIAGWKQFDDDFDHYTPREETVQAVGRSPESLPALRVEVRGVVTASNLDDFKAYALDVIGAINTELKTDQDFADAEKAVKWLKGVEKKLADAKDGVIGQIADVDTIIKTLSYVQDEIAKAKRLEIEKLVVKRKEDIKLEIKQKAELSFAAHIKQINDGLSPVTLPVIRPDFAMAMKGKKTVKGLQDAVDGELARAKIAATQMGDLIASNLLVFKSMTNGLESLFPDFQEIMPKPQADLVAIISSRIAKNAEEESRVRHMEPAAPAEPGPAITNDLVKAGAVATDKKYTPSRKQIIKCVADGFRVDEEMAEHWLVNFNNRTEKAA